MAFPLTTFARENSEMEIKLFGPLAVTIQGAPMGKLRSKSGQWLLALLAMRAGREVDRAWLAALLWPDADEPTGLANLRRTLTDLRSALGTESDRLQSPTNKSLIFDGSDCQIDVIEFESCLVRGDRQSLSRAAELHASPLLEGCTEEWITEEREPRFAAYVSTLEKLAEFAEDANHASEAIQRWKQVLAAEPLRESSARKLFQLLAKQGNYAEAVHEFRSLRDRLRYQLNLDPSAETIAAFKAIRSDAKGKARTALENPIESFVSASVSPNHSNSSSTVPISSSIPIPLTPLIGRELEAEELVEMIRSNRLISMIGSGGMGKTRLSIHAASRLVSEFEGGVHFVDLAPVDGSTFVVGNIAAVVGAHETAGADIEVALISELKEKSALLVLDNCEHLIEAAAYAAQRLLTTCPGVKILATSRQQLGLPGEQVWRIPAMEIPDVDTGSNEDLLQFDSIRLFVDRAKAVRPGFTMTGTASTAVAGICRRLDGCPLAIELAAARASVLGVEQIAERLDDRFKLLTSSNRAAMPRQQTLRALIDWSYNLLSESEKAGLRMLSVFHGGYTLDAAESILNGIELSDLYLGVFDVLAALVDKSLVIADVNEFGTRYRMLESIRAYGLEKLKESGEELSTNRLHRDWFMNIAEAGDKGMQTPEQHEWSKQYAIDRDNFRYALHFCIAQNDGKNAMRMAFALWRFWESRTEFSEGKHLLEQALAIPAPDTHDIRGRALTAHAILSWRQGAMDEAQKSYAESLETAKIAGDKLTIGSSTNGLANIANMSGRFDEASALYMEALAVYEAIEFEPGIATVYLNLGSISHTRGNFQEAKDYTIKSLETRRRLGDKRAIASVLDALAVTVADMGEHQYARQCAKEALEIYEGIGSEHGIHLVISSMSEIALSAGHYREAVIFSSASDRWFREKAVEKSHLVEVIDEKIAIKSKEHLSQAEYDEAYELGHRIDRKTFAFEYLSQP